ncbi:MAG: hypothetical protein ACR2P5_08420 [Gammaproteobacteria bacterium]
MKDWRISQGCGIWKISGIWKIAGMAGAFGRIFALRGKSRRLAGAILGNAKTALAAN